MLDTEVFGGSLGAVESEMNVILSLNGISSLGAVLDSVAQYRINIKS